MEARDVAQLQKIPTGIPGFDDIALGGLPQGRATLIAGSAGSAKTVFATQFLLAGIERYGEPGVFVTFEDAPGDLRENVRGFGWEISAHEEAGMWAFVDASLRSDEVATVVGEFDLSAMLARVVGAVKRIGAKRVAIDSVNALFNRFADETMLRADLFRLMTALKELGVTVIFTAERVAEYGEVTRFGIEEFVADNVLILRNTLNDERRRRTIEILKFRGCPHERGEFPFTINSAEGIIALPLSAAELNQRSSNVRISSGNDEIDAMCGDGFFRDSIILVSGATGTGKTLTVTQFIDGGFRHDEKMLLFSFEESRDQFFRNARGWGYDFEKIEKDGRLKIITDYPHAVSLEDHLLRMRSAIEKFQPNRMVVDSLSALERVATTRTFREFVINLTSFIKKNEIAGMFTSTAPSLSGGESVTEKHISTLTDTILLLRYLEEEGEMGRALTVLKMRGSEHDKTIRRFTIDRNGMHVGDRVQQRGILFGSAVVGGASAA
jgi:circadian clock protein KaiC